jgi:exodeoxyribonuclease X
MITVLDVETTGLDPTDAVVEIAAVCLDNGNVGEPIASFVKPDRPIPPEASGIHGIIDVDVAEAPELRLAVALVVPANTTFVAAHNARFDRSCLPMLHDKAWIDTYRVSLHLWKDAPNFRNMTLRYWLDLDLPRNGAHRATEDVIVTAHILKRQLEERTIDELIQLSTKRVVLREVDFGKYRGELWAKVPIDYLDWMESVGLGEFEPDIAYTVAMELRRRVPYRYAECAEQRFSLRAAG